MDVKSGSINDKNENISNTPGKPNNIDNYGFAQGANTSNAGTDTNNYCYVCLILTK